MPEKKGTALPPGLTVRKQGESLETVTSKAIEIRLLASQPGVEIIEGTLNEGERITLVPSGQAVETYYIVEGLLRCDLPSGPLTVAPRDYIIAQGLAGPTIFSAQTAIRFLYVTSHPTFHEVSQKLNDLMRLAVEVEVKDGYTADHCRRLQVLSYATGRELKLPQERLRLLDYGAYLHDVGKVKVPLEILQKPSALNKAEWAIMKKHPVFGRELLEGTFMKEAGPIVEQHHERHDGSGYPYGLAGDDILLESAIVAVADTYDAMTTERPYKPALSPQEALAEINNYAGRHYPKEVVEAFVAVLDKVDSTGR